MVVRWRLAFAWVGALLACSSAPRSDSGAPDRDAERVAALFSGRVQRLELELTEASMADLAREPRDYTRGKIRIGGTELSDVGTRFKGHRSMRQWADKPAFKLHFGKYRKDQRLWGLRQLVLNNMVEDPSMLREQLAYEVFRAVGAPAPRTGYAELFVNGQRFGLYTVVEAIDGPFLDRHFGPDPIVYEGEYGCDVYPDDVPGMALDGGDDPGRAALSRLARAADGPIMDLLQGPEPLLEPAHFFAFLVASTWVGDFDGYRHAHNYRLVFSRRSGRWSLMPWGLDRALDRELAAFDSRGRLARACFDDAACRLRYVQALGRALETLSAAGLPERLTSLSKRIEGAARRDGRKPHGKRSRERTREELGRFLRTRSAALGAAAACWDGSRELDRDGDGFGCMDCDDRDPSVHPNAPERCDGVDRDCSGLADDSPACPCVESPELPGFALCARPMGWAKAADQCRERGAVLADVDDRAQARALWKAAKAIRDDDWWVGLHDREREGEHRYLERSTAGDAKGFFGWASGEPDDHACGEDCGALKKGAGGKLRDLHCASHRPFICRTAAPTP